MEVELWCDGSGWSEGPGGYGALLRCKGVEREISGALVIATNNRAELMAAIKGLEAIDRPCNITVRSDSRYVVDAFNQNWIGAWKRKKWKKVKNVDLWKRLLKVVDYHPIVRWEWVPGHAGVDENERCDTLAGVARRTLIDAQKKGIPWDECGVEVEDITYVEQMELA